MPRTLLFEIGTEEIPAKFMPNTLEQIKEITIQKLSDNRINFQEVIPIGTPRRLTVIVKGLNEKQNELNQNIKGPAKKIAYDESGALTNAALGFIKSQGVSEEDVFIDRTGDIEYLYAKKHQEGKDTKELLKSILPEIIFSINFPKSMRWKDYSVKFARPIRWIVAIYGNETIEFSIEGAVSSNVTKGHRTLSNREIKIDSADNYVQILKENSILVDHRERKSVITEQIKAIAKEKGGNAFIDEELLEEVLFLVEYPTALSGNIEKEFLTMPKEAVIVPMKEQQRYFPVLDSNGKLMPYFITVRNGGKESIDIVREGNERVLRARLKDAQFFYNEDLKHTLDSKVEKLKQVVYQEKLGTIYEKVERVSKLADFLAEKIGLSPESRKNLNRAAFLCKADLETSMVYEFAELQGVMGREYAKKAGENNEVAEALYSHYLPRFSGDETPKDVVGQLLSIADKLDTIVGSFGIGVQPTGSQDPYGLRRQALGIIAVIVDEKIDMGIDEMINYSAGLFNNKLTVDNAIIKEQLMQFFKQRVRVMMIDSGYKYDLVDAILESNLNVLGDCFEKAEQLSKVMEKGEQELKDIITALKRVYNLVSKNKDTTVKQELFENKYEKELYNQLLKTEQNVINSLKTRNYTKALEKLVYIVKPINNFLDNVMVNVENEKIKLNRLSLLARVKVIADEICDFSKI